MDFIRAKISRDLETGKYRGPVTTRFPPEPNGFPHIGHAKAICLNFGIAAEHPGGRCHLRMDDTNPDTEKAEYAEAMKRDIRWLGFDWGEHFHHASDYFEELYAFALVLVDKGLAYVDDSTEADIREQRGAVTRPGVNSPYRERTTAENRDLFERMRAGEFPDESRVLRAKIDMAHPNMVMRDPVLYRIRHARHYRRGDEWPIYPMYDFAHCLSDSLEGITHSLCTLEFENNREIYDWLLEHVDAPRPRPEQTEFAPLAIDYVVTSKRKLRPLVERGVVRGWDDPRMFTLAGLRRRGVTPEAIRKLCAMVGVSKARSIVDLRKFEFAVREDLDRRAPRAFCVLEPLKVVLVDYPEGREERFPAPNFPGAPDPGPPDARKLPMSRVLYIDREDFCENPPPGFRRLAPGGRVRLKYAGVIQCQDVVRDPETGDVAELRCRWKPDGGDDGARTDPSPRVAVHWVSADHAVEAEVRLYDRLFTARDPSAEEDLEALVNPCSERVVARALVEPGLAGARPGSHCQFERHGYFVVDSEDSGRGRLVFNRTVSLKDSWKARTNAGKDGRGGGEHAKEGDGTARRKRANSRRSRRGTDAGKHVSTATEAAGGDRRGRAGPAPTDEGARRSFQELLALGANDATALVVVNSPALEKIFRAAHACYPEGGRSLAAWTANEVARLARCDPARAAGLDPAELAALARAVDAGNLSHRRGRMVLEALVATGGTFEEARKNLQLTEVADPEAIEPIARALVAEHPAKAAAYRGGRQGLLGFFVGQVLKRTGGAVEPGVAGALLRNILEEDAGSETP